MAFMKRYQPKRDFPSYAFIPGRNPHPEKEGGHMYGQIIEVGPIDLDDLENCEDFLFALDLFNHGYFWEAHVYWEAGWNLHGRKNEEAQFLQGLIKLAAAGVKFQLEQIMAAQGHIQRAKDFLNYWPFEISISKLEKEWVDKSFSPTLSLKS